MSPSRFAFTERCLVPFFRFALVARAALLLILSGTVAGPTVARGATKATTYPPPVDTTVADEAARKLVAAESDVTKAKEAMRRTLEPMRRNFEASPEYVAARERLAQANAAYAAAREPVLQAVRASAAYRAVAAERDKLDQHVQADRTGADAHIVEAASQKLASAKKLTDLESAALAAEPKVAPARAVVDGAVAALNALDQQFRASISTDPSLVAARDAVDSATRQRNAARVELATARQNLDRAEADRLERVAQIDRELAAQRARSRGGRRRY